MATSLVTIFADWCSRYTATMKLVVILLLAAVVVSLFSGLVFLVKDKDATDSTRMLTSLKIRVALSATLILVLVGSYLMGWMT